MPLARFDDFASLCAAHPECVDEGASTTLFETIDWFSLFARETLPKTTSLHLFLAMDTDAALCLPLQANQGELTSLSNYYTGVYGPALCGSPTTQWQATVLERIFRQVRKTLHPAVIHLQPLDPAAPLFTSLHRALAGAGYRVVGHFCFGNWFLPCAGLRYADFLAARPSAWTEEGLPTRSKASSIAARASGRSGAVAFQSR